MATSINGWPVLQPNSYLLKTGTIPTVPTRRITMHKDVLPLFLAIAADYHHTVEPIDLGSWDEGGYSYRKAAAGNGAWSDHSSGTAMDLNWSKEGANTFSTLPWWKQKSRALKAARIKRRYKVVVWGANTQIGGDYRNYNDPMHWTLKPGTTVVQIKAVMRELQIDENGNRATAKWRKKLSA